MKKIACVGILVADVIVRPVDEYPERGALSRVDAITVHSGGNAMTASINLRKMGVESKIIGKVGKDMFGTYLKDCLGDAEVDTAGLVIDPSVQTSASVLMVDSAAERSFFHCVGANGVFSIADIDFDVIAECDAVFLTGTFLLGTFDGIETRDFLKRCKEMGKTTFLDVCWDASDRWGEILDMSMPYIDFFMPSIDEAVRIAKCTAVDDIADVFMKKGVKNVIIKMGSRGAYLRVAGEEQGEIYPAVSGVTAVDTTGAGDSFCSGFLAAYARGEEPKYCMRVANATGALSVMKAGATAGIKTYEETIEFMESKKC